MSLVPFEQRAYPGAAADTVLAGSIGSTDLGFTLAAGTGGGYPDGTTGPFFVVIDYDTTSTEKLHCTSRTGDVFVVDLRGADGTTPLAHSDQAKVRACFTATDAQEANRAAHQTLGQVTTKGDLLPGSSAAGLTRLAVGTDGQRLTADSTAPGGMSWKTPIDVGSAWIPWTPVITATTTDPTVAVANCAYKLEGKTLFMRFHIEWGTPGNGAYSLALPDGLTAKDDTVWTGCYDLISFIGLMRFEAAASSNAVTGLVQVTPTGTTQQWGSGNPSTARESFTAAIEVA